MSVEIKVPVLPESIADATIAKWYKKPGESVNRDEHLVDIETDKVILEVVAPGDGSLETILKSEGSTVGAEEVIALFNVGRVNMDKVGAASANSKPASKPVEQKQPEGTLEAKKESFAKAPEQTSTSSAKIAPLSPAARRLMTEQSLSTSQVQGTGKVAARSLTPDLPPSEVSAGTGRPEKRVTMTRLRARIAERLLQAQQTAAILTTFNEINMHPVMDLRQKYKDQFEKRYGVRLGFMSFFVLATLEALKRFPMVNASIDGNDIVYHGYYDIGIAVSSPRGLVVPIIRNADDLSMADIEKEIAGFGQKAKEGTLTMEEITGGTFTISNGGVFGSLMSTPILNPPQSGILGMHKIEERPMVENGQIVVRPMMYVALSYDHRIIDGSESVRFLVTIKELLEDPSRILLGI